VKDKIYCKDCEEYIKTSIGPGGNRHHCKLAGVPYFDPMRGETRYRFPDAGGLCEKIYGTKLCKPKPLRGTWTKLRRQLVVWGP